MENIQSTAFSRMREELTKVVEAEEKITIADIDPDGLYR